MNKKIIDKQALSVDRYTRLLTLAAQTDVGFTD